MRPEISKDEIDTWVPRGLPWCILKRLVLACRMVALTVGGAPEELAPKAVIDWLNGRAKGYTTRDGNEEVRADWSTGKVGMTGPSYNGTIPLAAATTGVAGLKRLSHRAEYVLISLLPQQWFDPHPGGYLGGRR